MTSPPAASSRSASRGVIPAPSATFSPLITQKSMSRSARRRGTTSSTARRPGTPNTSATKRMRTRRLRRLAARGDDRVVAVVVRVFREQLLLDAGERDDLPDPGHARRQRRADVQRGVDDEVGDGDGDGGGLLGADVEADAVLLPVEDDRRDPGDGAVDRGVDVRPRSGADVELTRVRAAAAVQLVVAEAARVAAEDAVPQVGEHSLVRA